ncbi:MAG: Nramp family divalent metal transporter [Candidatus Micrarchaeota archaeon]|nr:Nramp family divalent metal transporter [Candidatus Micrarchaeota archaeon]
MIKKNLEQLLSIPAVLKDPKFWTFFGTGVIVSVAYMDPGNWGTNISSGASFGYTLLWVVWASSIMAMLFQYLSGKIGIAGHSLPGLVKEKLKDKRLVFLYWLGAEIAILGTDLAEFLGIVVALNMLFNIPILYGSLIAVLDVLLFFALTSGKKFRVVEYCFMAMVGVIGIAYLYEVFITKPDLAAILAHSVTPAFNSETILLIVGIIGATVMPHAIWVHSWLSKNKMGEEENGHLDKKKALRYHLVDNISALTVAAFINAAMLIMAAAAFYNNGAAVVTMQDAYKTLTPLFGGMASLLFAIGLLSAGLSSSITATFAGQSIMDSLTDFKISPWVRRVITRLINLIPIVVAVFLGLDPLNVLVYSQVALSLLLPLPLIPLVLFSADKKIMGDLVNSKVTTYVAWLFTIVILLLNVYLLYSTFFLASRQ